MRPRATTLACLSLLALARPAVAQERPGASPYQVDWMLDLSIILGSSALWMVLPEVGSEVIRPICPCSSSAINGIDRFALGRNSGEADVISDWAQVGMSFIPVILDAIDVHNSGGPWIGFLEDLVVMGEVVALNGAVNQLVKYSIRRPRPSVYNRPMGDPVIDDYNSYLSFYSGHTSTAFAAGMAYASTFALRHPGNPNRAFVYVASALVASSVGLTRVLAGEHFPTDSLAGAAVGTALGLFVPRLHKRRATVLVTPTPGGAAVVLTGRL